jgi:hypothetical protein
VEENFYVFLTSTPDKNERFVSSSSSLPLDRKPSVPTGQKAEKDPELPLH